MPSIFTRIVQGEIPCHKVYEDEKHLAFLDIHPIQRGHTLVIPKREIDSLFDLAPDEFDDLWRVVHRVAAALKDQTGCERVVLLVVGYEVPHAHVHLVPTFELDDYPIPPRMELDAVDAKGLAYEMRKRFA
jgi:histidine triad (HIT) family protein